MSKFVKQFVIGEKHIFAEVNFSNNRSESGGEFSLLVFHDGRRFEASHYVKNRSDITECTLAIDTCVQQLKDQIDPPIDANTKWMLELGCEVKV